jgi:3-oxoacyl-[acyl-carrier protein] reductase
MSDYAVVTGGSGNIGGAIAKRLSLDGFKVVILDYIEPTFDGFHEFLKVDLTDADLTAGALAKLSQGRRVTRLVNSAGIVLPAILEDTDPVSIDKVMALNIKAPIVCAQALLPSMKAARIGRIVNISSRAALGKESRTVYSASKGALNAMTRTWAMELGRYGITVNAVGPGPVRTALFDKVNPPDSPQTKAIIANIPAGFMGGPEDIAHAVSFFVSDEARFVNGQILYVCGGITAGLVAG